MGPCPSQSAGRTNGGASRNRLVLLMLPCDGDSRGTFSCSAQRSYEGGTCNTSLDRWRPWLGNMQGARVRQSAPEFSRPNGSLKVISQKTA